MHRWRDNIKMNLKEIVLGCINWIHLTSKDGLLWTRQWIRGFQDAGNFVTSLAIISFSRRTMLPGQWLRVPSSLCCQFLSRPVNGDWQILLLWWCSTTKFRGAECSAEGRGGSCGQWIQLKSTQNAFGIHWHLIQRSHDVTVRLHNITSLWLTP
jgi:hypothetical protein